MKLREEIDIAREAARMLRPTHVADVASTQRLFKEESGGKVVAQMGAFARHQFASAAERPNGVLPVVIPAHNEQRRLPGMLAALARTGEVLPIVVDNRSTDATAEYAARMGAVVLEQPSGKKMAATKRGITYVLHQLGVDRALFMDADTLALPRYPQTMSARLDELDSGNGAGVFGSSYRMFGRSKLADTVTTAANFHDNVRRELRGSEPVPHGHTFGLRFDAGGAMEAGLLALPDDMSVMADEQLVADDVAIYQTVRAAGAVVGGCIDPDSFVITENRINSFSQLVAMHRGATWEDVTRTSYIEQYGATT